MKNLFNAIIFLLIFTLGSRKTSAYLDPGTGSFLFQLIVGAVLGGVFTIKMYFKKIKIFFYKLFKKDNENDKQE